MGTIATKDTRRISFDNTFALGSPIPSLTIPEPVEVENVINDLPAESPNEIMFREKSPECPEDSEMNYWTRRIDYLKKEHQIINKIIETEYDKSIEKTIKNIESPKITHERIQKIKPCFDWRVKILKCYEENSHQPLVCSALVQAFSQCVTDCKLED